MAPGRLCAPPRLAFHHLPRALRAIPARNAGDACQRLELTGPALAARVFLAPCRTASIPAPTPPADNWCEAGAHGAAERARAHGHWLVQSLEAARGGAAGRDKRQQQRAQTSSSSWLTRPKIAGSICCSPRSASRRCTRACSSAVRKWASRLSASEQRASASSPHDPGLGSRAQRSAGATASATVPGVSSSPGPRAPAAVALRERSATIPSRIENQ